MAGFRNQGYLSRCMFSLCCLTSNARARMGELYVCSVLNGFTSNIPALSDMNETQRKCTSVWEVTGSVP